MAKKPPTVAFVEDADEESLSSTGGDPKTRIYATSSARVQPNTSRSRRLEAAAGEPPSSNSDSATPRSAKKMQEHRDRKAAEVRRHQLHERERERERAREAEREKELRRKAKAKDRVKQDSSKAEKKLRERPNVLKHSATQPVVNQSPAYRRGHDESTYYGISQPATSASRPRTKPRPASFYAGQTRPSPATSGWAHSPMSHGGGPPAPYPAGSFHAPPSSYSGPPTSFYGGPPPPSPLGYFDPGPPPMPSPHHPPPRDLRERFGHPSERPSSAMGYQSPAHSFEQPYDYDYDPRRSSRHKPQQPQQQYDEDRKRMPPPSKARPIKDMPRRPSTTAPPTSSFSMAPPPRPDSRQQSQPPARSNRRSVGFAPHMPIPGAFDDDDEEEESDSEEDDVLHSGDEGELFQEAALEHTYDPRRRPSVRSRRQSHLYDEHYDVVPGTGRARRGSTFGEPSLGTSLGTSLGKDNRYMDALRYQNDASGGPQTPLTAETLRKANKGVASSRSTRSSASRDESEYKRSHTTGGTGVTHSSNGPEDFTMKITGQAVVRVGKAEIECADSQITFTHPHNAMVREGSGSDQASSIYQLDEPRREPRKALPHRARASSQADSQSRGYLPSHAPYEHHAPYEPQYSYS